MALFSGLSSVGLCCCISLSFEKAEDLIGLGTNLLRKANVDFFLFYTMNLT